MIRNISIVLKAPCYAAYVTRVDVIKNENDETLHPPLKKTKKNKQLSSRESRMPSKERNVPYQRFKYTLTHETSKMKKSIFFPDEGNFLFYDSVILQLIS